VADKASDDGYKAVARLRLAGLLIDAKPTTRR
jgi:predicted negative regulator of RcsB-dependent stress response